MVSVLANLGLVLELKGPSSIRRNAGGSARGRKRLWNETTTGPFEA
jgi:hypothetical protein